MKMTHALVAMLLFGVLLWAGGYTTLGMSIIERFNLTNPAAWTLVNLGVAAGITAITIWATGGNILTAPAITIMVAMVSAPLGAFDNTVPFAIKTILLGFWLFIAISGVGSAIRGEY